MSKAGLALKQVLETHNISQYKLAAHLGINRSNFSRWLRGERDPLSDVVVQIYWGLNTINPVSAEEFLNLYLGRPQTETVLMSDSPAPPEKQLVEDRDSEAQPPIELTPTA
jgi:transcriptional regulator with XRE-family HTH domain